MQNLGVEQRLLILQQLQKHELKLFVQVCKSWKTAVLGYELRLALRLFNLRHQRAIGESVGSTPSSSNVQPELQ